MTISTSVSSTSAILPNFKKLVEADDAPALPSWRTLCKSSLFDRINEPDSTVEVLAGARKFIEGWNSWRVSNMGLLNIGTQRRIANHTVVWTRRSVARDETCHSNAVRPLDDGSHPDDIRLLETLNIFALRANYMAQFRDYSGK